MDAGAMHVVVDVQQQRRGADAVPEATASSLTLTAGATAAAFFPGHDLCIVAGGARHHVDRHDLHAATSRSLLGCLINRSNMDRVDLDALVERLAAMTNADLFRAGITRRPPPIDRDCFRLLLLHMREPGAFLLSERMASPACRERMRRHVEYWLNAPFVALPLAFTLSDIRAVARVAEREGEGSHSNGESSQSDIREQCEGECGFPNRDLLVRVAGRTFTVARHDLHPALRNTRLGRMIDQCGGAFLDLNDMLDRMTARPSATVVVGSSDPPPIVDVDCFRALLLYMREPGSFVLPQRIGASPSALERMLVHAAYWLDGHVTAATRTLRLALPRVEMDGDDIHMGF